MASASAKWGRGWQRYFADARGAQIVELAISLPLLMVLMVGVIDFAGAFVLKHKLGVAVQEGARLAATRPFADVTNSAPQSTSAVRAAVASYLASVDINDCGLAGVGSSKVGLVWTYAASTACPGNGTLTLTIDRGTTFQTTSGTPLTVEAIQVSISYPYQWRFGRVIQMLFSGAGPGAVTQITADATVQNLD